MPYSYYFSVSTYDIFGIPFNIYLKFIFLIGFIFGKSFPNYLKKLTFIFIIFNIIEFKTWEKEDYAIFFNNIIVMYFTMVIGYITGHIYYIL